jgi:hypothetical protein
MTYAKDYERALRYSNDNWDEPIEEKKPLHGDETWVNLLRNFPYHNPTPQHYDELIDHASSLGHVGLAHMLHLDREINTLNNTQPQLIESSPSSLLDSPVGSVHSRDGFNNAPVTRIKIAPTMTWLILGNNSAPFRGFETARLHPGQQPRYERPHLSIDPETKADLYDSNYKPI